MNGPESEPKQILEVLQRKADITRRALGKIEDFKQKISSVDYPLATPQFPVGLDLVAVSDVPDEFARRADKVDSIGAISCPRALAIAKFRLANLENAVLYGNRMPLLEARRRADMMTEGSYQSSVKTFKQLAEYAIDPFASKNKKVKEDDHAKESVKLQSKYEIDGENRVKLASGLVIIGRKAQAFSIICNNMPGGISLDDLTAQMSSLHGEKIKKCYVQTTISSLRRALKDDEITILGYSPLNKRRKGVQARYTLEGLEKPQTEQKETKAGKRPLPHLKENQIAALRLVVEDPFALGSAILDTMGETPKGNKYHKGTGSYSLVGAVGLLYIREKMKDLEPDEKELLKKIRRYIDANALDGKLGFQYKLKQRLGT